MAAKPKLFVLNKLPEAVEARFKRDYDVRLNPDDKTYTEAEIVALSQGMDGIVTSPTTAVKAAVIEGLDKSVRIIATFSVGFDHVELAAAGARGITVTNTPEVLTDATADMTMLLLLAGARRAYEGQKILRENRWIGWRPTQLIGIGCQGKRLGIYGMGRIGQAVARRAKPFGFDLHYHDQNPLPPAKTEGAIFHADVEEMLPFCDYLTIHCPLTPETRKFLNAKRIAKLPKGAVVVNTARGPVIDDEALIAALESGHVAAAGLDVFEGEPKLHPGYLGLDNAYLLPHLGSATLDTRNAMGFRALDNLDAFFKGQAPRDRVA
ncbi:MAG: D-glycerate dehydrogenase [Rhodospirillales bacterium]|nr:D-glycerate dehydrogenase [Rhodospirillales bacterium]MSP80116.1 D-glycerate dehydrogenase [Rhodospirillales bacterium]